VLWFVVGRSITEALGLAHLPGELGTGESHWRSTSRESL